MKLLVFVALIALTSCSQKIYVVRHAEKATPAVNATQAEKSNPDLSTEGNVRAVVLQQRLSSQKVKSIYSTNYKRTIQTATPLANSNKIPIVTYHASMDSIVSLANRVKSNKKGNVLIVGHSNTIDNITNALVGEKVVAADIPETDYDNLFIIIRKGKKYSFKAGKYGGK